MFTYCPIFFCLYINWMPKITYVENEGKSHTVEVDNGLTVMEGAVQNNIPGILFWTAPSITLKPFVTSIVWFLPLCSM